MSFRDTDTMKWMTTQRREKKMKKEKEIQLNEHNWFCYLNWTNSMERIVALLTDKIDPFMMIVYKIFVDEWPNQEVTVWHPEFIVLKE